MCSCNGASFSSFSLQCTKYVVLKCFILSADTDKNTPLFFAAEGGHLPCVALLMVMI